MKARVFITLKKGVLDPQGKAIGHALNNLGFDAVGLPEYDVFWQRKGELDQLALVFSGDLANLDAVENELAGLWRV